MPNMKPRELDMRIFALGGLAHQLSSSARAGSKDHAQEQNRKCRIMSHTKLSWLHIWSAWAPCDTFAWCTVDLDPFSQLIGFMFSCVHALHGPFTKSHEPKFH